MVKIHHSDLDEQGLRRLIADRSELHPEIIDGAPVLKIWLIPEASDEDTKKLFVFAKIYHFATDGLSIM